MSGMQAPSRHLSGALDDLPEQAFFYVGNVDEAKEKAKTLAAEAGA